MSTDERSFKHPPVMEKEDGSPRQVGFELEFIDLELDRAAEVLQETLGGELEQESEASYVLSVEELGDFTVELDWSYLKKVAAEGGQDRSRKEWIRLLKEGASLVVPVEIVCPPIPIDGLEVLHSMTDALRKAGAQGTESSWVAAFGVHVNPETPALDASTLFAYLRAFSLMQWWLVDRQQVNISRKVSPYIDLYPESYVKKLLKRGEPDMGQIFEDYLEENATRNRALDMLPMLAHIDEERIAEAVEDDKVKARPTFHYRLPDCNIEKPEWSLTDAWQSWWRVEELANRPEALEELGDKFLEMNRFLLGVSRSDWVEVMDAWLRDHALV